MIFFFGSPTWICCARGSYHGSCPSPSLGLAPCLWSCGRGLCLVPALSLFPSPVPSLALSPSRGPAAPFPALALFPAPSVPARTPAAPSPSCPFLLRVSAEHNTDRFSRCHARFGGTLLSICYGAQIKWFPHLRGFIQKHALISAKLAREAGDLTGNLWKDRKVPPHRDTVSSVVSSNMLSFPACSKKVQLARM